jgi:hypothetical protein
MLKGLKKMVPSETEQVMTWSRPLRERRSSLSPLKTSEEGEVRGEEVKWRAACTDEEIHDTGVVRVLFPLIAKEDEDRFGANGFCLTDEVFQ